ncbi:hypothetical protein [Flavobacterium sp.]|jgi:DNA-binding ferritin-like protein|uniref:hypothetical protein n=1 Tax=Flavobacterium sp. TaxID=239 RepID=UPI0037C1142D
MLEKSTVLNSEFTTDFLSKILVDEYGLFLQTKVAYWNFEYSDFYCRNRLFEIQSAKLFLISEEIGRQIIALGHYVVMSNEDFFLNSNLNEVNYKNWSKQETTKKIMENHLKIKNKIEEWSSLVKNDVDKSTYVLIDKIIFNHKEMIKELKLT